MVATGDGLVGDLGDREWSQANVRVARLHSELARTQDPSARSALGAQLREAREAIAQIEARWRDDADDGMSTGRESLTADDLEVAPAGETGETVEIGQDGEIDALLAELLADDVAVDARADTVSKPNSAPDADAEPAANAESTAVEADDPSLPPLEVLEAAITTARSRIFDRAGRGQDPTSPEVGSNGRSAGSADGDITDGEPSNRGSTPGSGTAPDRGDRPATARETAIKTAVAFAIALLVGTAIMAWWSSRGSDGPAGAPAAAPAVDGVQGVDDLEAVLNIFGFGELEVVQDGTTLRISGTVANVDELRVVRETARALAGDVEVDTNGVQLAQLPSGVSESSASSVGAPVESTLQRDLARLLATTPVMFAEDERDLGELDRRILNAVAALIRAAPAAEVTIIGRADDADLATARAQAVLAYLVDQGVREESLVAEAGALAPGVDADGHVELVVTGGGSGS